MFIPLSSVAISPLLNKNIHLEIFDSIASTNDYLLENKQLTPAICLAEHQTKGRGQLGRRWHSPRGENIYLSYACHLPKAMGELGDLSNSIAKTLCDVLNLFDIKQGLSIKWPNDVLFEGKKLAGILIDVQAVTSVLSRVVIGVGLNVNMEQGDELIEQPWTAMKYILGKSVDRNEVVAGLVNKLAKIA